MREGCICGCLPPREPNPDCERCDFVCEVEQLRAKHERTRQLQGIPVKCWKIVYRSKSEAKRDAKRLLLRKVSPFVMRPYKCPFCKCWHLTRQRVAA